MGYESLRFLREYFCFEIAWDGSFWCLGVLRTLQSFACVPSNLERLFYNSTDKVEALQTTTRHHYWHLVSNEDLICDCTLSNRFARLITVRCIIIFFYILYEAQKTNQVAHKILVENIKKDNNTANCD